MKAQLPAVLDEEIGDLVFLEVSPEVFDRVEFRGVGGQAFEPEAAARGADSGWSDHPAHAAGLLQATRAMRADR